MRTRPSSLGQSVPCDRGLHVSSTYPKQAGTARAQLAPSPEDLARANRWRQALLCLLAKHQLSPAGLARRIGAPNPNAIYNFLNRISHSLSQVTLERICVALPGTGMDDLFGLERPRPSYAGIWVTP